LMYFNARYYSQTLGRFVSADTIVPGAGEPQALNRYAFVFNNPLKYTDPSGHMPAPRTTDSCGPDGIYCNSSVGGPNDPDPDPLDLYFASLTAPDAQLPGNMTTSPAGVEMIIGFEGIELNLYNDGSTDSLKYDTTGQGRGHCTIGVGHLVHTGPCSGDAREAPFGGGLSNSEAAALLRRDLRPAERIVRNMVKVKLTQHQFDVLVSLVFNWGGDRFGASDKLRLLNSLEYVATADSIRRGPITSNGVVMEGLVRRRATEADVFLTVDHGEYATTNMR